MNKSRREGTSPPAAQPEYLGASSNAIEGIVGLNARTDGAANEDARCRDVSPPRQAAYPEAATGNRGRDAMSRESRVTHRGRPNPVDGAAGGTAEGAQGIEFRGPRERFEPASPTSQPGCGTDPSNVYHVTYLAYS